jgi:hypothetical protein
VVLSLATCASFCGCATGPDVVSSNSPGPSRSEANTDRATLLVEARKIYKSYVHVSSEVSRDRGRDVARLRPYLTSDAFSRQQESVASIAKRGLRTTGEPRLVAFEVQTVDRSAGSISAYACVDFSRVRVKDRSGKDVTPASRPSRQTSVPTFIREDGRLVLSKDGSWSGKSIC